MSKRMYYFDFISRYGKYYQSEFYTSLKDCLREGKKCAESACAELHLHWVIKD